MGTLDRPTTGTVRVGGARRRRAARPAAVRAARPLARLRLPAVPPHRRADRRRERRHRPALRRGAPPAPPAAGPRRWTGSASAHRVGHRPHAALRRRTAAGRDRPRPGQRARRWCWPTSRPAPWTPPPGARCWTCCTGCTRRAPRSRVITHDRDIAAALPRRVEIRDGRMVATPASQPGDRERSRCDRSDSALPGTCSAWGCSACAPGRLRAALSALGIAIGIATMVVVTGIPASSQPALLDELTALGTNMLQAEPLPDQDTAGAAARGVGRHGAADRAGHRRPARSPTPTPSSAAPTGPTRGDGSGLTVLAAPARPAAGHQRPRPVRAGC